MRVIVLLVHCADCVGGQPPRRARRRAIRGAGRCRRLHRALRVLPRPSRRTHSDARGAGGNVRGAHPAHARLRTHDEHRVHDEARRARGRGRIPRHGRRRNGAAAERVLHGRHAHLVRHLGRELDRLGTRKRQRALSAGRCTRASPPATLRGSSSSGPMASPATSSPSRHRRSSTARCSSAAPAAPCRRSTRRAAACTGFIRPTARFALP